MKDGGPAFPHDKYLKHDGAWGTYAHGGMTLRDYFAGQALAGMGTWVPDADYGPVNWDDKRFVQKLKAEWAYAQADAMIAAREPTDAGEG